ncbi:site-specific integrase [Vibrio parahaemolyticus]|nr:site-specific integrase [Vibrio parahaemolyticus]
MYLLKTASSTYYTRICLPKRLKDKGFPFDVKVSLFTKCRSVAVQRHIVVLSDLHPFIHDFNPIQGLPLFQKLLSEKIDKNRDTFQEKEVASIPARKNSKPNQDGKPIKRYLERFLEVKTLEKLTQLSVHQLKTRCEHFIKSMSVEKIPDMTPSVAMRYRELLLKQQRSDKTNRDYIAAISQFCSWCIAHELLVLHPFQHIKLPKQHSQTARPRWSESQLKRVFRSSAFKEAPEQFQFVCFLMLYHGCRPAEACQLSLNDICLKTKALRFTDALPKQHLKNPASKRQIPLHQALLQKEFISYISKRREQGHQMLFDYTPLGDSLNWSKQFTTQLGRLLSQIGFTAGRRPTAYSFRHTFIDEMKQKNISEFITAQIVGHSYDKITYGRYGKTMDLATLRNYINQIHYDI